MDDLSKWYRARKRKKFWKVLLIILAVMAVIAAAAAIFWPKIAANFANSPWEPFDIDEQTLKAMAPVDEKASAAIEAMPDIGEGETWAFYIYMIGSNLESCGIDETSAFVQSIIKEEAEEIALNRKEAEYSRIKTFAQEVTDRGCELPNILFVPTVNVPATSASEGSAAKRSEGAASTDISTMMVENFPESVTVLIQTGGAKRWENSMINPNRTQRFTVDSKGLHEVYNGRAVNMGSSIALADFLSYSVNNYPADHKALILWDHGGGATGFGSDELFGGSGLTLADITAALSVIGEKDSNNPVFDIIGFDACLMGCAETAHALYGYGQYLLGSEELEPGEGWDYETLFTQLGDNPRMNPAMIGKVISDSFVESSIGAYAEQGYVTPVTFSVIDINGGEAAYNAWTVFCESALRLAGENPSNLAKLSQAANASVAFGQNLYRVINMLDLGMFMNEARDLLPNESAAVLRAMERAVLYTRSSSYLKDCMGISVFFPARIEGQGGIDNMLAVMESGVDSDAAKALFYYKVAGCLNDALAQAVSDTLGELPVIDYSVMNTIPLNKVKCYGDGNMSMTLTGEQFRLTQDTSFEIVQHDTETDDIVYYGEDAYSMINDDSTISTSYSGKWIFFGDLPLPLDIVSKTGDDVTFRTKINYNGISAWLLTGYNGETDEISVLGIREEENYVGTAGRDMLPLKKGDLITIEYETGNLYTNASGILEETIIYSEDTVIEEKPLEDGHYYEMINVYDIRSDTYSSAIAGFDVTDGVISNQKIDDTIFSYEKY